MSSVKDKFALYIFIKLPHEGLYEAVDELFRIYRFLIRI